MLPMAAAMTMRVRGETGMEGEFYAMTPIPRRAGRRRYSYEQEFFGAQLFDLVAQLCGPLELEAFGRFAHVVFQSRDEVVEVFLRLELRNAVGFRRHIDVVGFD